jgi:hypothetical protein
MFKAFSMLQSKNQIFCPTPQREPVGHGDEPIEKNAGRVDFCIFHTLVESGLATGIG